MTPRRGEKESSETLRLRVSAVKSDEISGLRFVRENRFADSEILHRWTSLLVGVAGHAIPFLSEPPNLLGRFLFLNVSELILVIEFSAEPLEFGSHFFPNVRIARIVINTF